VAVSICKRPGRGKLSPGDPKTAGQAALPAIVKKTTDQVVQKHRRYPSLTRTP